ncbi:replication protein A 70 kDa DNA-binding subunit-like isoform X2 [Planococcus citri]|uniref:replication protein A 70 kDa DNA-binding subunit-like isoform X2 n=1 Tax=Planococcus citri TaxID=170843 RepID=UPI0031F78854
MKDGVRRKVQISDGVFFTELPSTLSWKVLEFITDEELQPWSVVVLNKYNCSKLNYPNKGKWIMILIDKMTVLRKGCIVGKLIGNPIPANEFQIKGLTAFEKSLLEDSKTLSRIAALNHGWCIKARIVSKGDIQKLSSEQFFNLELADLSGSILATAYDDACRKFYDLVEVNKVYLIRKYYLQHDETSARRFKLILKHDSEIEPAVENIKFDFCTFRSIRDAPLNAKVDVIGICLRSSEVTNYEDESRK